jgi:hypothetical protein
MQRAETSRDFAGRRSLRTLDIEEKRRGTLRGPMSLSQELLVAEAERLIARAEREVRRNRRGGLSEKAERAEFELKRLQLYRAVLRSSNSAHALMPEYILARGLVETAVGRGTNARTNPSRVRGD